MSNIDSILIDGQNVSMAALRGWLNSPTLTVDDSVLVCPEIKLRSIRSWWIGGAIDVANNGGAVDYVSLARIDPSNNNVGDLIYHAHNGLTHATTTSAVTANATIPVNATTDIVVGMVVSGTGISGSPTVSSKTANSVTLSAVQTVGSGVDLTFSNAPTFGFGVTPPNKGTFRMQVSPADSEPGMGALGLRVSPNQTGDALQIYNSIGGKLWGVDFAGALAPSVIRDAASPGNVLSVAKADLSANYTWKYNGNSLVHRYASGGVDLYQFNTDGTGTFFGVITFNRADVKADGSGYLGVKSKTDGSVVYSDRYDGDSITRRYHTGGVDIRRDNTDGTLEILGGLLLRAFTVGTLPAATARLLIYVSDGTSNKRLAIGDGTNFRFPDGNVVS